LMVASWAPCCHGWLRGRRQYLNFQHRI
jgi:hypothetical protein